MEKPKLDQWFSDVVDEFESLKQQITTINKRLLDLESFEDPNLWDEDTVITTLPEPEPEPEPLPDYPMEPTEPSTMVFQVPALATAVTFEPQYILENEVFSNPNTALLAEVPGSHDNRVYRNCRFVSGRYAAWIYGQKNIVFIDCEFSDHLFPREGGDDESTIRIENSSNILFFNCKIDSFGVKHAFRVHGPDTDLVVLQNSNIRSEGNGIMLGSHLGSPSGHHVNRVVLDVVSLKQKNGNDCFDPKRDGSLTNFVCKDVTINYGINAWNAPADVAAHHPTDWTVQNLVGVGPNNWTW